MKPKAAVNRLIPKTRSRLRVFCGAKYYTLRRSMRWYFGGVKFARLQSGRRFPCTQFCHATPLYRKLQNADRKLQQNKAVNLRPAIASLDGLVLQPGETFSLLLKSDRPPVAAQRLPGGNGPFLRNLSSRRGRRLVPASNLIYWMTLHTDLTVTERYRHSYDVFPDENRTQPFGSGATCVYNYRDLMVENRTVRPFSFLCS
ncbi:MAG: VanW family protein [Clostridiales bacterium]|nr:VanW family protein [Clostridiales bacterium]